MKNNLHILVLVLVAAVAVSCDKTENLLLSDSEILMKDLSGTYRLDSVKVTNYYSVNGGNEWVKDFDSTYVASGQIVINTVKNKNNYTGIFNISFNGLSESHSINGSCYKGSDEDNLWVITDNGEDIQSIDLYSITSANVEARIMERSGSRLVLRFAEVSWNYAGWRERYFIFTRQ